VATNLERFKDDLEKLIALGKAMKCGLIADYLPEERKRELGPEKMAEVEQLKVNFEENYQCWYSQSLVLLKQLLPDRLPEFVSLYHGDGKHKKVYRDTFNIQDWLKGLRAFEDKAGNKFFDDIGIVLVSLKTQIEILKSIESRFESSLFDVAHLTRMEIYNSELSAARGLAERGFLRGAGAIAGVVIEKHLGAVCDSHAVTLRTEHPTIKDLSDQLKKEKVVGTPTWKQIRRLEDLRHLCDERQDREPTKDEVKELIDVTEKLCHELV
jgi:hypothetical protein